MIYNEIPVKYLWNRSGLYYERKQIYHLGSGQASIGGNHVLRYWEEELELNIPRNELGHRYYREEEIQLLHCIKELKNKGFQLKAVKEVLPDLEQKS